jgi:hypothetical protein
VAIPLTVTDPGTGDTSSQPDDDSGEADDCSLLDEFAAAAAALSKDAAGEAERVKPAFMTRKPVYLNFTEARKWARAMGMGSRAEWDDWAYNSRRNPYIPRDPEKAYGDQFTDWDDVRENSHPAQPCAPFRSRHAAHGLLLLPGMWGRGLGRRTRSGWG